MKKNIKISMIGSGQIGSNLALFSMIKNLCDEIVLFDVFQGVAKGKALDLSQTAALLNKDIKIFGTDKYEDIKDSDVCIVTAGFPRKPNMSRNDLLSKNLEVINQVADGVSKYSKNSFVIIVTNPLDIMVYSFYKKSNINKNMIVGMAGVLDSARFKSFLKEEIKISYSDINTFVLGGHGDDMVPITRFSTVNGINLEEIKNMGFIEENKLNEIINKTRVGGGEIVKLLGTGSAYYTPALSAIEMADCFINNKKRILPCAAYLNGEYGVKDFFIGVPVIIGSNGVEKIIELKLNSEETKNFNNSIESVKKVIEEIKNI